MTKDEGNPMAMVRNYLTESGGDQVRGMLQAMAQMLMSGEADAMCGAAYGERSEDRTNTRNGYRYRDWDTRTGTINLAIPKLREGSYYPEWLLEPRRRSEKALTQVIAEAYVNGVSTRRVEKLAKAMGIETMSKSQVSELAKSVDQMVEDFRNRPLENGPYTYIWLDATYVKAREHHRVASVAVVVAIGVNVLGCREILGIDVITTEDGSGWLAFLRGLVARGLSGVQLAISDAHNGIQSALRAVFPGTAWQRCRAHFMRNVLSRIPRSAQDMVASLVRTIFAQGDRDQVHTQFDVVVAKLKEIKFVEAADMLTEAKDDILAFAEFPKEHWKQIWSNNPLERLNKEIKRRTDVVGIFPSRPAVIRLIGAVLTETNDEWAEGKRYMNPTVLAKARLLVIDGDAQAKEEKSDEKQKAVG